jgi:hypothetical protein
MSTPTVLCLICVFRLTRATTRNYSTKMARQIVDDTPTNGLYSFMRGRFVQNEAWESSQSQVSFNMKGLCRVAAKVVGSDSCIKVESTPMACITKASYLR